MCIYMSHRHICIKFHVSMTDVVIDINKEIKAVAHLSQRLIYLTTLVLRPFLKSSRVLHILKSLSIFLTDIAG